MAIDGFPEVAQPVRRVAAAAPLSRRFAGWIVDGALALSPIGLAALVPVSGVPHTVLMTIAFLGTVAIGIANDIVLVARTGQSVGRRLLSVQVLDSRTMVPPNAGQVIVRNFIGGAGVGFGFSPWFLHGGFVLISPWPIICYAFAVTDRRWHRGLNDRWASTVVIDVRGLVHR